MIGQHQYAGLGLVEITNASAGDRVNARLTNSRYSSRIGPSSYGVWIDAKTNSAIEAG